MQFQPCLVVLGLFLSFWLPVFAPAQDAAVAVPNREAVVVDSAAEVLGEIMSVPGRGIAESLLAKAEGIVIIPGMLKGGFIVGVRYGHGVIVTRDEAGRWKPPMFVEITGASVGWQIGVQGTDLVLVFRTKKSLQHLLRGKFTIGAHASAAAGPVGREAEAATDGALQAEIYSYSRSRGLFAGVALDGAVLNVDREATNAYYRSVGETPAQPGQPIRIPASAGRLLEKLDKYTAVTVPSPVSPAPPVAKLGPADPQALRRDLAGSWRQLAAIVDAPWRTFLALPAEIYSGDRPPSAKAIRLSLDRFTSVAADPRYQSLTQRGEFQTTLSLLRQYAATIPPESPPPLSLPPPPK
jgi:SH3 domain-containing YSC84-like protein 1